MQGQTCFENYPLRIVAASNILNFSIWIIGFYILLGFGLAVSLIFLAYCVAMELRVMAKSCVNCYYYGKTCFSGRGRVCAALFKRGDPNRFISRDITWKDIIPDFLVSIIPIFGGIVLLLIAFSWTILILLIVLFLLTTAGNGAIRGRLACKYCKRREMGCPALKLFEKKRSQDGDSNFPSAP